MLIFLLLHSYYFLPFLYSSQSVILNWFLLNPDKFGGTLFVSSSTKRMVYRCFVLDAGSFRIHKDFGEHSSTSYTLVVGELMRNHEKGSLRTPHRPWTASSNLCKVLRFRTSNLKYLGLRRVDFLEQSLDSWTLFDDSGASLTTKASRI